MAGEEPHEQGERGRALEQRLRELGVATAADEVTELVDAYPALLGWMRIAERLGRAEEGPAPP